MLVAKGYAAQANLNETYASALLRKPGGWAILSRIRVDERSKKGSQ